MKKSAQKTKSTTQQFIEIKEIAENIVLFYSGNACLIIETQAINFALLSKEEQDSRVLSYSSLLNSISFPIQIFIRSKKIDISSYLHLLDNEMDKSQNQLLRNQIKIYRDFVAELVKTNVVLDKKFYIIIPYSPLESGIGIKGENLLAAAKSALSSKAESLLAQLGRMNLHAKVLDKENLIKLFHEIYNGDFEQVGKAAEGSNFPIIRSAGK